MVYASSMRARSNEISVSVRLMKVDVWHHARTKSLSHVLKG